ncbi:Pre-rRNA-processing protein fhl1 [Tulasnella sp. 419]|nr:Pre-rRNA-processing protein fhl1 [Tulasnella sp. 419]
MQPASEPIQAYYKLSFPNFEYYLQTLSVTIGRRPVTNRSRQQSVPPTGDKGEQDDQSQTERSKVIEGTPVDVDNKSRLTPESAIRHTNTPDPQSSASSTSSQVDVDLGPLKSVSRLHARIDYDESLAKFVLSVHGRNGAWVDGEWVGCGGRVALGAKTKIQIATRTFYFVLPPPPTPPSPLTPDTTPDEDREPTPLKSRRASSRASSSHSQSPARSASPSGEPSQSSPRQSVSPHRKRKGKSPPLHIVNPESEDEQLVSIDGLEEDELDQLETMDPDSDDFTDVPGSGVAGKGKGKGLGKGKGKGKLPGKGKGKLPLKSRKPVGKKPAHIISSKPPKLLAPPTSAEKGKQSSDPDQPKQPRKYNTARAMAQAQLPPRPPPDQMPPKPPYTYAILCYRAINALGGKASLSEIVNWIREKYEWYRWNDQCGWESSVRHNLSSNPAFLKSRRDAEVEAIVISTGQQKKLKGFFWSVDPKSVPSFEEKEKEYTEMGNRAKQLAKGKGKEGVADPSAPGLPGASNGSSSKMTVPVPRLAVRPPGGIPVPPMAPHMPMMMPIPLPPHPPPPIMHQPIPGTPAIPPSGPSQPPQIQSPLLLSR